MPVPGFESAPQQCCSRHPLFLALRTPTREAFAINGQNVLLVIPQRPAGNVTCVVTQIGNGFIGCRSADRRESYYNLETVTEIRPAEQ
jgi:hypothetical protein